MHRLHLPPPPTVTQPRSFLTLSRTLPDELKIEVLGNLVPTGEYLSAHDFLRNSMPPTNRVLLPLATSAETHGITKELIAKRLYTENTFEIMVDPTKRPARVLYPTLAIRPHIQHLRVEIPSIGARTVPFLLRLAHICQTFTGLQTLTLRINGISAHRHAIERSDTGHGMIYFPTPVLRVEYMHNVEECDS
jgi:hypothetical protein